MIFIIILILILVIYFDVERDFRDSRTPTAGGAIAKKYYEQTDETDKRYRIVPYSQRYATGDLGCDYPQHPYISISGKIHNWEGRTVRPATAATHWGQRKLLLSEIDLFTRFRPAERYTVVYAGAADGRHMPILTEMFPNIVMHLYDPRPFYPGIANERIIINSFVEDETKRGWFTDAVARHYATTDGMWNGTNLVFVSDIRTEPTESEIEANQRAQERWVRTMRPRWSMLKFKTPYPDYKGPQYYKYMVGDIRLQCWAPVMSAETRLITRYEDVALTGNYPMNLYERNCAWYNYVMRPHDFSKTSMKKFYFPVEYTFDELYAPYVKKTTPIGFDFVYETQIIVEYLKYASIDVTIENIRKHIDLFNSVLVKPEASFHNYLKSTGDFAENRNSPTNLKNSKKIEKEKSEKEKN